MQSAWMEWVANHDNIFFERPWGTVKYELFTPGHLMTNWGKEKFDSVV